MPFGWRPTGLVISVHRYRCSQCAHVWHQATTTAAAPRAKLSRAALRWALTGLVVQHLSVQRVAEALDVSWNTANRAVLDEGRRVLINDDSRFDGVSVIGVDEHVWRHTKRGDKYVTVIIDLTPVREKTGPARLLDMVEGRSKAVFTTWLQGQTQAGRDRVEVVAMDGFTGFKTASEAELPDAVEVLDPVHVVKLAGDTLDTCRQRVQQGPLATEVAPATRSTAPGARCARASSTSPTANATGSTVSSRSSSTPGSRRPGASTNA